MFVLFPSLTPKYLGLQSIKCKTIVTHNNFRHCKVHLYAFVRQRFSKQLHRERARKIGRKMHKHFHTILIFGRYSRKNRRGCTASLFVKSLLYFNQHLRFLLPKFGTNKQKNTLLLFFRPDPSKTIPKRSS